MRIGLITTGDCEQRGLADSLSRVFTGGSVQFETCFADPVDSITSNQLFYPVPAGRMFPTYIDRFVDKIAFSVSRRGAPDYVFAIDDLELVNVDTSDQVVASVRSALNSSELRKTHRGESLFRDRCSVHFLCPMVESYFFGEPAALRRGGASVEAILDPNHDLETFTSADTLFLGATDAPKHLWRTPGRAKHPKKYLHYLNDPDDKRERRYREGKQGVSALASLDWTQVFEHQPPGLPFVRSLFADLADAIGVPSPFPGTCHPLTERRSGGVLRNL